MDENPEVRLHGTDVYWAARPHHRAIHVFLEMRGFTEMTERDLLLQAILDNPDADGPRLILADHLEEHGEMARASFIRVQVELAKRGCVDVWCEKIIKEKYPIGVRCEIADECDALRQRERELLQKHLGWFDQSTVPYFNSDGRISIGSKGGFGPPVFATFSRGFVSQIECKLASWIGGECAVCQIDPTGDFTYHRNECRCCHGIGTIPGIGPALVRQHPVRMVATEVNDFEQLPEEVKRAIPMEFPARCGELMADTISRYFIAWAKAKTPEPATV